MIHPKEGYMGMWGNGDFCKLEGKHVEGEVSPGRLIGSHYFSSKMLFCNCFWPLNNLQYLEWKYEQSL